MHEVGEVLHRARSGRLIIRLGEKIGPGTVLLDSKGRKAARLIELIGPVSAPYGSAAPLSEREGRKEGQKLFIG